MRHPEGDRDAGPERGAHQNDAIAIIASRVRFAIRGFMAVNREAKQRKKRAAATARHTVARIGGQPTQPQAAEVEVSLQMRETPEQLLKRLSSGIHRRRLYKRRHNPCIQ